MAAAEIAQLDREKITLSKELASCSDTSRQLDAKLQHIRKRKEDKVKAMADASAMFLHGRDKERTDVVVKDSKGRVVRKSIVVQPMGRRDAVSQTRRRIAKQASQLQKECSVTETRRNKMQMRINRLKEEINICRQEGQIFDKTFGSVHDDLLHVKEEIAQEKRQIKHCYAMRDVARQEGRASIDRMKADRAHALMQFEIGDKVIADAKANENPDAMGEDGQLSREQEDMLRQRIKESVAKAQSETVKIHRMKLKQAEYETAIEAVLEHTGCEDVDEVVEQLNSFEEEKFERASAVTRTMEDIEAVEKEVSALRDEYSARQQERDGAVLGKAREMEAASAEMEQVTWQLRQQEAQRTSLQSHITATMEHVQRLFREAAPEAAAEAEELKTVDGAAVAAAITGPQSTTTTEPGIDEGKEGKASGRAPSKRPKRRRRSSIATATHIVEGVSVASLPSFLQAIEDGVSDLVQRYAVATSDPLGTMRNTEPKSGRRTPTSREARLMLSPEPPVMPKPTVQLGPSAPRGALSQSLTSSALMVAMLDVVQAKTDEDVDERPLTLDEMKEEAARTLQSGAFAAVKQASEDTARMLDGSRQRGRGLLGGTGMLPGTGGFS